jgi:exonuclease SbcD
LKIAITADLHLTTREEHPQRFGVLENILQEMVKAKMHMLIVAGDLFDESTRRFADFESICKNPAFNQIRIHVIPGNHDPSLDNKKLTLENVTVYSEPYLFQPDFFSPPFLFLPYCKDKTMGEVLAPFAEELTPNAWVLIAHGDWIQGMRETNPLEPGVYMPLTRTDMDHYQPIHAILGHIHKPTDQDNVHYPGSPCPMDITETGQRRFLIFDSERGIVKSAPLLSDVLYYQDSFVIFPMENEELYIRHKIEAWIDSWGLSDSEKTKVQLRVQLRGYSSSRHHLQEIVKDALSGFKYYKNQEPDLSEVYDAEEDVDRAEIIERVSQSIEKLEWPQGDHQPNKDHMLIEALKVIYGD